MATQLEIECLGSYVLRGWWGKPQGVTVGARYILFRPKSRTHHKHVPYFLDDGGTPRSVYNGDWRSHKVVDIVPLKDAKRIIQHYEEGRDNMSEMLQEQPQPNLAANSIAVVPEVMKDLTDRLAKGVNTYGTPLMTHNGRNALQDLYEELLDAACYVKQLMMEQVK
ncbi:hypothetical protein [Vibrio vulnificus]|uniref:hypothetical protein n=1 Tax=Vibrio vulnificus TaxID=672 RepID=UPI001CC93FA0|nr:hypothetical protein [Vibrio vulnificus]